MRHLLLIRHAAPAIDPNRPAEAWPLSAAGRAAAAALAESVRPYAPARIIGSETPKAAETAAIIAAALDIPWQTAPDLHEHDRRNEPFTSNQAFKANVRRLFSDPNSLFFGGETAAAARDRFAAAVDRLLAQFPAGNLAIATHGTVMALLLMDRAGIDPAPYWEGLALPDLTVVRLPDWQLIPTPAA